MFTINGGKTFGCAAIASLRALPPSTSARTCARTFASGLHSVCSSRIVSDRNSDSPALIIVANCRDMIARSFSPILLPNPGMLMSRFIPALASVIETGA